MAAVFDPSLAAVHFLAEYLMGQEYTFHVAAIKHINSAFIGGHNPNLKVAHVPNQTRDATEAFFNKQLGVLPGFSDLIFGWPHKNTGVIELKSADGKLSPNQNKFLSWAHIIGWKTGTAKTVKQVHDVLLMWGLKAAHDSIIEPDYSTKQEKFQQAFDMYKPF